MAGSPLSAGLWSTLRWNIWLLSFIGELLTHPAGDQTLGTDWVLLVGSAVRLISDYKVFKHYWASFQVLRVCISRKMFNLKCFCFLLSYSWVFVHLHSIFVTVFIFSGTFEIIFRYQTIIFTIILESDNTFVYVFRFLIHIINTTEKIAVDLLFSEVFVEHRWNSNDGGTRTGRIEPNMQIQSFQGNWELRCFLCS